MISTATLKEYLQKPYESPESFLENVIFPVFGEESFEDHGKDNMLRRMPELQAKADASGVLSLLNLGGLYVDGSELSIFDITISSKRQLARCRVEIQDIVRRVIGTYSGAFMIFHYCTMENKWDWRFSFCRKGNNASDTTEAKRFTFLLGPGQSCRTAAENFVNLGKHLEAGGELDMDDIVKAFDVEALSKEFFLKYKQHYELFCNFIYEHKNEREWFGREFAIWDDKTVRDYVKKLLGRLVFLHFLQKKGWMGVPADKDWGEGDPEFMRNLFHKASDEQKENYLDTVLEPLFSKALDSKREGDLFDTGVEGYRNVKIPYLNGGLFEREVMDEPSSRFPAEMFENLFEFFYEYNFTIDENDPNDAQVGVDPEMLGMIFENLLEDNKDKGAFYTPKEIVQYMCKESLIAYLQNDVEDEEAKTAIRNFVKNYDVNELGGRESELTQDVDGKLIDVKICDPAIGSGAFPMGLLKELFYCRGAIEDFQNAAGIKKHIIQHNIYGVDIEKGAVDIARLRFWLALIVDEETPHALPNMDFKIMQGNSLLEQYQGVDLSSLHHTKTKREEKIGVQMSFLDDETDIYKKQFSIKMNEYFSCKDHDKKVELRQGIRDVVQKQLQSQAYNVDLTGIDIAANSEFFLWHTWFSEVFEQGGFDIVIGNPPYINVELIPTADKEVYKKNFKCFYKRSDIFALFLENALMNLSNENAISTFIIPSVVHTNMSYQPLRNIILNNNWLRVVCYTGGKVFNAPTVDTTILIMNKSGEDKIFLNNAVDFSNPISHSVKANYFKSFQNVISVGVDDSDSIYKKLFNSAFLLLGEHYNIFQGIVTGLNLAYIFENAQEAINKGVDESLLHPFVQGKDIAKYAIKTREKRILYLNNDIIIQDYPSTEKWMLPFKEELSERREAKNGTIKWFSLQWPRAKKDLDIPCKILMQRTRNEALKTRIVATIDEFGVYGAEGIYFLIPTTDKISLSLLLGVLNSSLMNYLFATKFLNLAIKKEYVKSLRIPYNNKDIILSIENAVDAIISKKKSAPQADTSAEEHEIDQLVYELYGLTPEEIAIVEGKI